MNEKEIKKGIVRRRRIKYNVVMKHCLNNPEIWSPCGENRNNTGNSEVLNILVSSKREDGKNVIFMRNDVLCWLR